MEKQIQEFLSYMENDKKLSENTLQSYRRDVLQFQEYVESNKLNYSKIKSDDINEYVEYLKNINKKSSTI